MTTSIFNELAEKYFHKKGYKTESGITIEGVSGMPRKFDLIIRKLKEQRVVKILNWNRTVGINIVINADKDSEDVGLRKPIVISAKFSSHAKAYANRKGVTLLTKRDLDKY